MGSFTSNVINYIGKCKLVRGAHEVSGKVDFKLEYNKIKQVTVGSWVPNESIFVGKAGINSCASIGFYTGFGNDPTFIISKDILSDVSRVIADTQLASKVKSESI